MTKNVEAVLKDALSLTWEEKCELMENLENCIEDSQPTEYQSEVIALLDQRISDFEAGKTQSFSIEEAVDKVRERIRESIKSTAHKG